MSKIEIQKIVEKMDLKNLTPDVGLADKYVEVPDINRPALQLTGFFDHFDAERVQIIGYVEYTFLEQMDAATKSHVYETLLAYKIPCIIFCRALRPDQELLEKAKELDVPIFSTEMKTSDVYRRADPLAECAAGTVYFHPRRAGGCVRRGCSDHGRERHRQERGSSGADQERAPSCQR